MTADRPRPLGTIYFWPDSVLYVGTDMINETHRHFTASVMYCIDGAFKISAEGLGDGVETSGAMVAPNVEQHLEAKATTIVILQVDPQTDDYAKILHRFRDHGPAHLLDDDTVKRLRVAGRAETAKPDLSPLTLWDSAISVLEDVEAEPRALDRRIVEALDILKRRVFEPPTASEVAKQVGLSEGRLIHLFSEQMGLPMRRYMLWLRLRDAFFSLGEGKSLTQAAHHAGFSDSAHLSRTFRGMFGLPPSVLLENRGAVRVVILPETGRGPGVYELDAERWSRLVKMQAP